MGRACQAITTRSHSYNENAMVILEVGKQVHYQIPVFECDKHIGWTKHIGTVELLDEVRQMVLVIPETEEQPWRWVAITCVPKC